MKFVMINGHSCSGKSTVVEKILKEKERYYKLSYDSLKWGFSQYDPATHYDDVQKLVLALGETICKMKYNIVADSGLYKNNREKLFGVARRHGYEVVEINLEADWGVLRERFDKRLVDATTNPKSKIANKSPERFKEIYDIYEAEKNPNATTFRTDKQTADEVFTAVLGLIG